MKKLVVLAILLLTAGPVLAQPAAPAPKATTQSALEARVNQRIVQMKRQLKITPAQEPAWDGFAQVMRQNVTATDKAYQERAATLATMSAPDNMRNFAQIEQARAQGIQNLAASFQTLYDGLSDSQKMTADTMFRQYADHRAAQRQAPK